MKQRSQAARSENSRRNSSSNIEMISTKFVEAKRKHSLEQFNGPIHQLISEDLLKSSLTALVMIEIEKIKEEYYESDGSTEV